MKTILPFLLLVSACASSNGALTPVPINGSCETPLVVEKQTCAPRQCGTVGGLYCGECEQYKGAVCEENLCRTFCTEMKIDERCNANDGWYKHQFSYRCHAHFEKATCMTMSDHLFPEDSVRCCHFESDDEVKEEVNP